MKDQKETWIALEDVQSQECINLCLKNEQISKLLSKDEFSLLKSVIDNKGYYIHDWEKGILPILKRIVLDENIKKSIREKVLTCFIRLVENNYRQLSLR